MKQALFAFYLREQGNVASCKSRKNKTHKEGERRRRWRSGGLMSCKNIHLYAGHKQNKRGGVATAWPQTLPQEMQSRMQRIPPRQISTWGFSKPGAISSSPKRVGGWVAIGDYRVCLGVLETPWGCFPRQSYVIDSKSSQLAAGEYKWLDNRLSIMLLLFLKNYYLLWNLRDISLKSIHFSN